MLSKKCTKCRVVKLLCEFGNRTASRDGLSFMCKKCLVDLSKAYANANPEKVRAHGRAYEARNSDKRKLKNREWRLLRLDEQSKRTRSWQIANYTKDSETKKKWKEAHPERVRELRTSWNRANPEKCCRMAKTYRTNNPEKCTAQTAKKRATKINATPSWSNAEEINKIYADARRMTVETGIKHHVDHIVPLRNKNVCGLHIHQNLQILTAAENLRKHNSFSV